MFLTIEKMEETGLSNELISWFRNTFPKGAPIEVVFSVLETNKTIFHWQEHILLRFQLSGEFRQFHVNGMVKRAGYLEKGKYCGVLNEFHENGKLALAHRYPKDSDKKETEQLYHFGGRIKEVRNFQGGLLHGEFKSFSESGEIIEEGSYLRGNKHGIWRLTNYAGYTDVGEYVYGEKHGPWIEFFMEKEGLVCKKGDYLHGSKCGTWTHEYKKKAYDHNIVQCIHCMKKKYENGDALDVNQ